jgi:hypothetical protein
LKTAAALGHLACVQFLCAAHMCGAPPVDAVFEAIELAKISGNEHVAAWLENSDYVIGGALGQRYTCFPLGDPGHRVSDAVIVGAVEQNQKWLVQRLAAQYGNRTTQAVRAAKDVAMLELLRDLGFPWDTEVPAAAALEGDVARLCVALSRGCPSGPTVTLHACWAGSVDALVHARRFGSPWHQNAALAAAKQGHTACLRIAIKDESAPMWRQGDWDLNTLTELTKEGNQTRPKASRRAMLASVLQGPPYPKHVVGAEIWLEECRSTLLLCLNRRRRRRITSVQPEEADSTEHQHTD